MLGVALSHPHSFYLMAILRELNIKKLLIPVITALALSQNVFAGIGGIQVQLERLVVIDAAVGNHLAGNIEIKMKNWFFIFVLYKQA